MEKDKQGAAQAAVQQAEPGTQNKTEQAKNKAEPIRMAEPKRTFLYTFIVALYFVVAKLLFFMRFEGLNHIPKDRNVIVMGNHQCLLDAVTLALCVRDREIHFMGKKELWNNKILGWVFTKVHGFPVDRGNMDMTAVRTAMNVLKRGETLGIFPEGTRCKTGYMLPLLSGASMLALRSGCDVIPVYIDGQYRVFHKMTVRIGAPVPMDDLLAGRVTKDTCDALTGRIEESFYHLSGGKSRPQQLEA